MHPVELIFINWNSADLLFAAAATLDQTKMPYRICVVDNGSADDSCAQIRARLPDARLIEMGYNSGFATAVNAGLNAAEGRYALILNTDIEFQNDVPALLIEALRLLDYNRTAPSLVNSIVGPCMAVDIEKLKALGLGADGFFFDQRFFFFFEETDFCRRIIQAGGKIVYQPQAHLMHLQGESANKRPVGARVQFQESRYKYFAKHYGAAAVALLFAGTLLRTLVNAVVQTLTALLTFWKQPNKAWDKAYVYWALVLWHLLLCRPRWSFDKCCIGHQEREAV